LGGIAQIGDQDVAALIERMAEAAAAFIQGDMRRYAQPMRHGDDFTLMAPSGGEPRRGFDGSDEALDALSRYFHGGEAKFEVFQTYASKDLVVLVAIERQRGIATPIRSCTRSARRSWVRSRAETRARRNRKPPRPRGLSVAGL
jgi:hypothetical protein